MAKYSFTINTDSVAILAAVIAAAEGNASVSVAPVNFDNDDDNAPVNTAAPATDSAGMPWDERIHAKSKGVNKDGTWKRGRGVGDDLVAAVEAELRARAAAPIPTPGNAMVSQPQPVALQQPVAPVTMPAPMQPRAVPGALTQQPVAPAPVQQPVPQQLQQPQALDFAAIMGALQRAMAAGRVDMNGVNQLVAETNAAWSTNFAMITDFAAHPQMFDWIKTNLVAKGVWSDA